ELFGFGAKDEDEVHCTAAGFVRTLTPRQQVAAGEPRTLDLQLERGNRATGTVVDPAGTPLLDVYVAAVGMTHDGHTQYHYWVAGRTDRDGRFALSGIRADLRPTLLLRQDGRATAVYYLPAAEQGVHAAGTLTLQPPRVVRGRVLGADGKPVARVK